MMSITRNKNETIVMLAFLIPTVFIACFVLYKVIYEVKDKGHMSEIISAVKPLMKECETLPDIELPSIHGKALVWNLNSESPMFSSIGSHFKSLNHEIVGASAEDNNMTIFLINIRKERVNTYTISKEAAYKQYADIYVINWPEKKPLGHHTIEGYDPPGLRKLVHTPGYGNIIEPLSNWFAELPILKD